MLNLTVVGLKSGDKTKIDDAGVETCTVRSKRVLTFGAMSRHERAIWWWWRHERINLGITDDTCK